MQIVLTPKANRAARIRDLNDTFRRTLYGGKVMLTCGVAALTPDIRSEVLQRVRLFDSFNAENDPYLQHDFDAIDLDAHQFY